jgi:hypothetical protein
MLPGLNGCTVITAEAVLLQLFWSVPVSVYVVVWVGYTSMYHPVEITLEPSDQLHEVAPAPVIRTKLFGATVWAAGVTVTVGFVATVTVDTASLITFKS